MLQPDTMPQHSLGLQSLRPPTDLGGWWLLAPGRTEAVGKKHQEVMFLPVGHKKMPKEPYW